MSDVPQERKILLMAELRRRHPHIGNALERWGLDFNRLRALGEFYKGTDLMCARVRSVDKYKCVTYWDDWTEVMDIRNVGPRRMLDLVNFMRLNGIEFPWFAQWDEWSRTPNSYWSRLDDARRELPAEVQHGVWCSCVPSQCPVNKPARSFLAGDTYAVNPYYYAVDSYDDIQTEA